MNYADLVRLAPWQKKSSHIKDRDEWKCRRCTDDLAQLQVHHLYYTPNTLPWDYPDDALITLCELCHAKVEFYKWLVRNIWVLKDQGFEFTDMSGIRELVHDRLEKNMHRESAFRYIDDIKRLVHG